MNRTEKRRQADLRCVYRNAWDILTTWAQCRCTPGSCPLEAELTRLGTDPGGLLVAVVLGQPQLLGIDPGWRR